MLVRSPQCERRAVCERLPWPEKLLYLTGNGGYWFLIIARRIIFIPLYVSKDECVHDPGSQRRHSSECFLWYQMIPRDKVEPKKINLH